MGSELAIIHQYVGKPDTSAAAGRLRRSRIGFGRKFAGLGKLIEHVVTGIGVGVAGVIGLGVGGLLDSEMSSLVSIAAALRRSTETVCSRPLRSILAGTVVQGPRYIYIY